LCTLVLGGCGSPQTAGDATIAFTDQGLTTTAPITNQRTLAIAADGMRLVATDALTNGSEIGETSFEVMDGNSHQEIAVRMPAGLRVQFNSADIAENYICVESKEGIELEAAPWHLFCGKPASGLKEVANYLSFSDDGFLSYGWSGVLIIDGFVYYEATRMEAEKPQNYVMRVAVDGGSQPEMYAKDAGFLRRVDGKLWAISDSVINASLKSEWQLGELSTNGISVKAQGTLADGESIQGLAVSGAGAVVAIGNPESKKYRYALVNFSTGSVQSIARPAGVSSRLLLPVGQEFITCEADKDGSSCNYFRFGLDAKFKEWLPERMGLALSLTSPNATFVAVKDSMKRSAPTDWYAIN
jgi:hypothetical protein